MVKGKLKGKTSASEIEGKEKAGEIDLGTIKTNLEILEKDGRYNQDPTKFRSIISKLLDIKLKLNNNNNNNRIKGNPEEIEYVRVKIEEILAEIDMRKMGMKVEERSKQITSYKDDCHKVRNYVADLGCIKCRLIRIKTNSDTSYNTKSMADALIERIDTIIRNNDVPDYMVEPRDFDSDDESISLRRLFYTHDLGVFICDACPDYIKEYSVDDDPVLARMFRVLEEQLARGPGPKRKPMDVRDLCDRLALGFLRLHQGLDYEFVGYASHVIPVFSSEYGDGLHLNFFARPKGAPSDSPPVLVFTEVANGDPQKIIQCALVKHREYFHGDEDRPTTPIVYHPENESCVFCEHAKDGSLSGNYCLPPPLM